MKFISNFFDSELSFAQFRIEDTKSIVAFGPEPNTIVAVSYEGNYYVGEFDPERGGDCKKLYEQKIFSTLV